MEKADQHSLQELIGEISQGNENSFEKLYQLFSRKIYHTSRKMKLSHEEAEEVVQEVFLKIWKLRAKLNPSLSINAYMIAIVRSLIIKKKKKEARLFAYQQYQIPLMDTVSGHIPEEELIYTEFHSLSMEIIEKLPPAQRQVFKMKHFENRSFEEIAGKLNVSRRTVENQAFRATKYFKEKLAKLEIVSLLSVWVFTIIDLFNSIVK